MAKSSFYEPRLYRDELGRKRWKSFCASYMETDLWIAVPDDMYTHTAESFSMHRILFYRNILEDHIRMLPEFYTSLKPLIAPEGSHPLVKDMYEASAAAETGPMSAVAGAIAEYIYRDLLYEFGFTEVIVENGGDIFMKVKSPSVISVFAGASPLSGKIGLQVNEGQTPLAVCCSSGTFGHSLSLGVADACVIACSSGALADAYATAFCNKVKNSEMINEITRQALVIPDILSVVMIKDDKVSIGGQVEVKIL